MKGKEESSEKMLKERQSSQLSDIEFISMVIRKLNELTKNNRETVMNSLQTISISKRK